jgi:hypothetical protein
VACCHQRPPLPNLPWVMRWLHLLPQPNTFPDVQSNFHLKLHNHGIKVCSLPPPSCLPFSWHKSNIWRSLIPFLGVALFYRYVRVLSSPSTHFQIPAPASPTTFPLLLEIALMILLRKADSGPPPSTNAIPAVPSSRTTTAAGARGNQGPRARVGRAQAVMRGVTGMPVLRMGQPEDLGQVRWGIGQRRRIRGELWC